MLLDANILIYAGDSGSPYHDRCNQWLTELLESGRRVAMPMQSLTAFVRILTHPALSPTPAEPARATQIVRHWLEVPSVWIPGPGPAHGELFCDLVERYRISGNRVSDVSLAALALEHGLAVGSADSDFARFTELTWVNPLTGG